MNALALDTLTQRPDRREEQTSLLAHLYGDNECITRLGRACF